MSYTSIIINSGTAAVGSPIGLSIPTTIDDITKDKSYVLQFKARPLNEKQLLDNIYVGTQKLPNVNIQQFPTVLLDNTTFYDCYVVFTANSDMDNPPVTIGRIKAEADSNNLDIFEITELGLFEGGGNREYQPHTTDIQIIKQELVSMIEQLAASITLKASKDVTNSLTNEIRTALGQIQVSAGEIELKVSQDNIISSINMTPETIKINTNLLDLTGDLDLQGTFKCYKSNSNKKSNYLDMSGAMMFGYNDIGGKYPVFASGLWTDENMGYFSVGYTRADISDANGCLWISPQQGNTGCRLTYSKLIGTDVYTSNLYFQKDGSIDFIQNMRGYNDTDDNYTYRFDSGVSTKAFRCNNIRTNNIYPRYTGSYNIGSPSMRFRDVFCDSVSTPNVEMKLGTIKSNGSWNTYGPLLINSGTGYVYPLYNGNLSLGTSGLRFHGIYLVNSPSVSSDERVKTDIHYLDKQEEPKIVQGRSTINMNITTEDMHDFIKNDLKLASYRYNHNIEKGDTSVDYGFIAQDILYTKVGSEIIQLEDKNDLDSNLSYNQGNYITVIAGALQEQIKRNELLEKRLAELEERLSKLE